ncbi:MAG TPA: DUF1592 domain-containing protein, partial [Candidatus Nanopelagicales bacterium]|nr:DUF1592 domain-containing protein [Candidatus Nanopelagicales bacterium]
TALQVTPGLWADYQIAAEELSAMVTADQNLLARILPPDSGVDPDARARAFLDAFGRRVHRRPLEPGEVDRYAALFAGAAAILTDLDPFTAGVQLTLQAFLQSPHFVYRVELSEEARPDGLIPLSGYEIATKLSYLLWNTMPDDALLEAAEMGELSTPEGVRARAEQMLDDPRAHEVIGAFHRQLYDYKKFLDLNKDPALFPQFTPEVGEDMKREAELFVEDVIFTEEGGLADLLTSRTAFVNDRLAAIYGLEGEFTSDFSEVELDPATRSGFLTRLGFLAANGTARQPDSIHRGVFVNLRVLCADLPPPPNDVPALPPDEGGTNRDRVTAHTGPGTCGGGCHASMINPIGFAFEHYDAIGQHRTTDNGLPVDASASYMLGGEQKAYADAIELSQVIAESKEAHRCYAQHWLEFTYGRDTTDDDGALLDQLAEESLGGSPVKSLLLSLIDADSFLTRAPVEAP